MDKNQLRRMNEDKGFIAALDQSGGSTPKALGLYGIHEEAYQNDTEMFDLVHQMRTRIIKSPAFSNEHILGAILFENTMEREIDGKKTADYLWNQKGVVPFLKIDKGLAAEEHDVQLLKPMPQLDSLLEKAVGYHIFGTKERSVIKMANAQGIKAVVDQQFAIAKQVVAAGLVPIIEPEVDIHSPEKEKAEELLFQELKTHLDALDDGVHVMLKLSLPTVDNLYEALTKHPRVLRVVALSGGYPRDEANALLQKNHGVIASFSRALSEGLTAQQTDVEFDRLLGQSIQAIYDASVQ